MKEFPTVTNSVFVLVSCCECYIIENFLRIFPGRGTKDILVTFPSKTDGSSIRNEADGCVLSTLPTPSTAFLRFKCLKPSVYYMYHRFNIQQFYVLPTLYLCVLCGSEKRQRLFTYTVVKDFFPIQCSQISVRALICWKIHRRRPFVLPATTTCRWRWVWSNGGMILTGENWSSGRKTLYSVW